MRLAHSRLLLALMAIPLLALSACARQGAVRPPGEPATYEANILEQARSNIAYQRVLFTGARAQLAVMSLPPGGDIGLHQHPTVEHILFCAAGQGKVILDGVETPFGPGSVVAITAGTKHNIVNTG